MDRTIGGDRLAIDGTYNLRELGGHQAEGGTIPWGRFFRSDALAGLTPAGKQSMADLGIRWIVDLRSDDETVAEPTELPEVTIVHTPIFISGRPAVEPDRPADLDSVYDLMVDAHGDRLTEAVRQIAHADGEAVLVHCTAGKDRTGLVVALTLLALGVHRDAVVEDYALTANYLAGQWADAMLAKMHGSGFPVSSEVSALVTASPAALMNRIIDRWEAEWGSAADFLAAHGFTESEHALLRSSLLG
ncbi:tyrosine-protein phosphatase [Raineyella sp. LH-20]|uniref:tyrosine-protein phosphatase n=1 Tax=Raineyella sp. LH-20 TaxID=3081204 RepID=UPI0029551864|nr:tyrosine-protein phosphatase [Raineyella sp. LH-20]WOP19517.1 tyrosine-protein phosphatase [Raineyella sp. LH-20]